MKLKNNLLLRKSPFLGAFSLILFLFLIENTQGQSEKTKIKRTWISHYEAQTSAKINLDNVFTTSTEFLIGNGIPLSERNMRQEFFYVNGFNKVKENGELRFIIHIKEPEINLEKGNTDIGRSFITNGGSIKYYAYNKIKIPVTIKVVLNKTSLFVQDSVLSGSIVSPEFETLEQAQEVRYDLEGQSVVSSFERIILPFLRKKEKEMNVEFGTQIVESNNLYFFIDDTPSYQDVVKGQEKIKKFLKEISPKKQTDLKEFEALFNEIQQLYGIYQNDKNEYSELVSYSLIQNLLNLSYIEGNTEHAIKYKKLLTDIENHTDFATKYAKDRRRNLHDALNKKLFNKEILLADARKSSKVEGEMQRKENIETFFLRIEQDKENEELIKTSRQDWQTNYTAQKLMVLTSPEEQTNAEILKKIIANYGGALALQQLKNVYIKSELKFEDNGLPTTEEKWITDCTNFLRKRKNQKIAYSLIEPTSGWLMQNATSDKNWTKMTSSEYNNLRINFDPIFALLQFDIVKWEEFILKEDTEIQGLLCHKLQLSLRELNSNNQQELVQEQTIFVEIASGKILASETINYEEGSKISTEKKEFLDFKTIDDKMNIPHKIQVSYSDYFGKYIYAETMQTIQLQATFTNRIYAKGIYGNGTK